MRNSLRDPIKEIYDAARYLDAGVSAHLADKKSLAEELFYISNMEVIRDWTESIWGSNSPYTEVKERIGEPQKIPKEQRKEIRMPGVEEKRAVLGRDGFHCRFCGIPLIEKEAREVLCDLYPESLIWGRSNKSQHAALQAMWLQFDHLVPHARGGDNSISNIVVTCAPCIYGRMNYLVEEMGLSNPFDRTPVMSLWDGLERIIELDTIRKGSGQ